MKKTSFIILMIILIICALLSGGYTAYCVIKMTNKYAFMITIFAFIVSIVCLLVLADRYYYPRKDTELDLKRKDSFEYSSGTGQMLFVTPHGRFSGEIVYSTPCLFVALAILFSRSDSTIPVWLNYLMILLCAYSLLVFFLTFYDLLMNPACGKYSFDQSGVVFYTALKTYRIDFSECRNIRMILKMLPREGLDLPDGDGVLPFICLSRNELPYGSDVFLYAKRGRLSRRKGKPNYIDDYYLFEYQGKEHFKSFLDAVPEKFRKELINDRETLTKYRKENDYDKKRELALSLRESRQKSR